MRGIEGRVALVIDEVTTVDVQGVTGVTPGADGGRHSTP